MYTAKYLIYSYGLFTLSLIMLSFALILIIINMRGKIKAKNPIINISSDNLSIEIYTALKAIGVTLSVDQQRTFEQIVTDNHRKVGFRGGEDD